MRLVNISSFVIGVSLFVFWFAPALFRGYKATELAQAMSDTDRDSKDVVDLREDVLEGPAPIAWRRNQIALGWMNLPARAP